MSGANTNQGERAAEEIKGGIKGIHNIGEHLRHNINSFADDLIGGNKTHESTGFSADAKAAGAGIQAEIERVGQNVTGKHPNTAATGANPTVHSTTPESHATRAPVIDNPVGTNAST